MVARGLGATPFLDLGSTGSNVVLCGGERGLLGLAFHPSYRTNGFFYVYYTRDGITVRTWMGPWDHSFPDGRFYAYHRWDWAEYLLHWFDHELKGVRSVKPRATAEAVARHLPARRR